MRKNISFEKLQGLTKTGEGLTEAEVRKQADVYGLNEIVEITGNPWTELIRDTLKDPMVWFLLGIGSLFILVGEIREATILFLAILPLLLMDAFLHWRTQASTAGMRSQLSAQAQVIRSGRKITVDSRDIFPGDLVFLSPHQNLPADGIFETTEGLQIDESVLTGEAFPIHKKVFAEDPFHWANRGEIPVDMATLGYAGTRVLTGQGTLRVLNTGEATSYGEIVHSVANLPRERTGLQKSILKLVQYLIVAAGIFCVLLAGVRLYEGYGWLDALLSAATLAVAAIPEEFPVVFSFFLGVGIYRMAKRHALVRRSVSVENVGRITRICTDKTGTLTAGQLRLTHLDPPQNIPETATLTCALAASGAAATDPVDQAILDFAGEKGLAEPVRIHTFPFTEDRKRECTVVAETGKGHVCYLKGSPETVLSMSTLSAEERRDWMRKTAQWAREGHKVLACAWKILSEKDFSLKSEPPDGFHFAGLLAFEDPPRPEVAGAMDYCRQNGIRVLMITGDHPETAAAVAKEVRLGNDPPVVLSAEDHPEQFEEAWLNAHPDFIKGIDAVARCNPLQKLRIVNALRKSGELVAVTGDGVNDVPALKAADIGIAMGLRGTRSAREVSSIILGDDNFSTIANAVREGRQLFSNLKKSFEYLLLFHIPFVLTAALIPFLGFPLLYLPIHVVWLELYIHPTALFAFQQPALDTKSGTPLKETSFFSKGDALGVMVVGVGLTAALALAYVTGVSENSDVDHARAKVLAMLSLWSAGLVLVLTGARTIGAKIVVLGTLLSAVLLIQLPISSKLLHLTPLHFRDWLILTGITGVFLLMARAGKWIKRKA